MSLRTLLLPALLLPGLPITLHAQAPAIAPSAPTELLNGRDLTGWRVFLADPAADTRAVWSVLPDGVLRLSTKARCLLRTEKTYTNYHLHAEWRWPANAPAKTNGGLFFHIQDPDALWPVCLEVQIANGNAGQLVAQGGADIPGAPLINAKKRAPKLAPASEKPIGEWNTCELTCKDGTVSLTINGVKQNHAENLSLTSGAIGFQLEGFPVDFQNLRLTPLPPPKEGQHPVDP